MMLSQPTYTVKCGVNFILNNTLILHEPEIELFILFLKLAHKTKKKK